MGEKQNERGLFEIYAVDAETDEILYEEKVIADGENQALFESNLKEELRKVKKKKYEVHIVIREIGEVPPKEKGRTVRIIGQLGKTLVGRETK